MFKRFSFQHFGILFIGIWGRLSQGQFLLKVSKFDHQFCKCNSHCLFVSFVPFLSYCHEKASVAL